MKWINNLLKNDKLNEKKSIENLIFLVILLIVVVVFINYIWNDNSKKNSKKEEQNNVNLVENSVVASNIGSEEDKLKKQLEEILSKLDGVEKVSVLITYVESNKIVPIYNIDNQESTTKEEDNSGGLRTINETTTKKEIVYEEANGDKTIVKQSIITPEIKGAVIMAKGANSSVVKANIIQAVEAATGLPTHKIQVFEMK